MVASKILSRFIRYVVRGIPTVEYKANNAYIQHSNALVGKRIVITGGGRGLGLAMARKFIDSGAEILICGRNLNSLQQSAKELGCQYLVLDVADVGSFDNFINGAVERLDGIDCFVSNAGISLHERSIFDVTPEGWDRQFDVNLKGPFFLVQKYIRYLMDCNQRGNILFISSETGDTADMRPYGYTKAATNSMVEGLAFLLKNRGIRVNAVAPGITASDMTGVAADGNLYAGTYGQGRFYIAEEIAEVATFLLSDAADCISGQIISCNNAQTINARWK